MTIEQYITEALKFEGKRIPIINCEVEPTLKWGRLVHAALGLTTEAIEFQLAKDLEHQVEEIGDIMWFAALAHNELGIGPSLIIDPYNKTTIIQLCEAFGSRIKAALIYGNATKPEDKTDWREVPYRILKLGVECSTINSIDIFGANIQKLKTRYGAKHTDDAAVNRNLVAEANILSAALKSGNALQFTAPPKPPIFVQDDTKHGKTHLGD